MFLKKAFEEKGPGYLKSRVLRLLPPLIVFCLVIIGGINLVALANKYTADDLPNLRLPQEEELIQCKSNYSEYFDFNMSTSVGVNYGSNDPDLYYYLQYTVDIEPKIGVNIDECYFTVILNDWFKENSTSKFANYFGTPYNSPVSINFNPMAPKGVFLTKKIYFSKFKTNPLALQRNAETLSPYIYAYFDKSGHVYKYSQNQNIVFDHPVN